MSVRARVVAMGTREGVSGAGGPGRSMPLTATVRFVTCEGLPGRNRDMKKNEGKISALVDGLMKDLMAPIRELMLEEALRIMASRGETPSTPAPPTKRNRSKASPELKGRKTRFGE